MVDLQRPWVRGVLAMGLDGKIAPVDRSAARFSSPADFVHLETQVAAVDGVIMGAGTLRAYGTSLSVRDPALVAQRQQRGQAPQPVHLICSASGQLDRQWRFFQQPVPRWLLTTPEGARPWQDGSEFERILPRLTPPETDWRAIAHYLAQLGLTHLALLGGGTLMAHWFEADLVDDLYLTLCPIILGGATAPTPCDGPGWGEAIAPRFSLQSHHILGDEIFLHYRRRP